MKSKRIGTFLCTALILTATGCGSSGAASDTVTVDTIDFNNVIDKEENTVLQSDNIPPQADNEQLQLDNTQLPTGDIPPQADKAQSQSDTELYGSVESISNNSVIINKTFILSENEAVSYGDSEKVLITVHFSEETKFEVWTVKNGGVNGDADIEKRQGTISDLEMGSNLNMTGNYEGNDFHAKQVIIYKYV